MNRTGWALVWHRDNVCSCLLYSLFTVFRSKFNWFARINRFTSHSSQWFEMSHRWMLPTIASWFSTLFVRWMIWCLAVSNLWNRHCLLYVLSSVAASRVSLSSLRHRAVLIYLRRVHLCHLFCFRWHCGAIYSTSVRFLNEYFIYSGMFANIYSHLLHLFAASTNLHLNRYYQICMCECRKPRSLYLRCMARYANRTKECRYFLILWLWFTSFWSFMRSKPRKQGSIFFSILTVHSHCYRHWRRTVKHVPMGYDYSNWMGERTSQSHQDCSKYLRIQSHEISSGMSQPSLPNHWSWWTTPPCSCSSNVVNSSVHSNQIYLMFANVCVTHSHSRGSSTRIRSSENVAVLWSVYIGKSVGVEVYFMHVSILYIAKQVQEPKYEYKLMVRQLSNIFIVYTRIWRWWFK